MSARDTEPRKPSLRVSHVVYGRRSEGHRVTYLVDPRGLGEDRAVPETVVLRRWRSRKFPGYAFSGTRLSSTLWRALPVWLGPDVERWYSMSLEELTAKKALLAGELNARNLRVPEAECARALVAVCGGARLRLLVERHAARGSRSGVPDLFLFASDSSGGSVMARFVEVKKPEEQLSSDQRDEIAFMLSIGLNARVLRLQERSPPRSSGRHD